jgi:gamma-glutamylcysteine synthetase
MPPGAPAEAVQRVNKEMNAVLADPEVREQLAKIAFVPLGGTPQALPSWCAASAAPGRTSCARVARALIEDAAHGTANRTSLA